MNRRIFLLSSLLATLPMLARAQADLALTDQDRQDLARIQTYLNSIHTLKARFQQLAPDGQMTQGTAWLSRPGRMRFQYDPPTPLLLVAGHGFVVFHDGQLGQTSNIPIDQTPLGILLRDNLSLNGDVKVIEFDRLPGMLSIKVVRTASPGDGSLTLTFVDQPLMLRQWTVIDAQRRETRVFLSDVQTGGTFEAHLFEYVDPKVFDEGGGNSGR
jgi:outer membrane lipoprotein-sorting protein